MMCRMQAPPVVGKDVEYAEHDDKEGGGPLGLEAEGDHDARSETKHGKEESSKAPRTLDNESEEEENKKDTTRKKEAVNGV